MSAVILWPIPMGTLDQMAYLGAVSMVLTVLENRNEQHIQTKPIGRDLWPKTR